jgi:hypothetical protein
MALAVILVFVLGAGAGAYISGRNATAALSGDTKTTESRSGSDAQAETGKKEAEDSADSEQAAEDTDKADSSSSQGSIARVQDQETIADTSVADIAEKVMPAIVSVYNKYTEKGQFFGRTYTQEGESAGSGIIIEETDGELLIVTNNHVVEGADSLSVQFIDEENCEAALKGTDASSDLAVIAVSLDDLSASTKEAIAVAELGDSDSLRIGEHAEPQADAARHRAVVEQVGYERAQQLLVILLVRAVQKERVPTLSAADPLGLSCEPPDAGAHAVQHMIAELAAVPLVDRMQVVDVAGQRIQHFVLVNLVETLDITEEVLLVQQPRQPVALGMPYEVAVL